MTTAHYLTVRETADMLNMTVAALYRLHNMFASPGAERPGRGRPFRVRDVLTYKRMLRNDRNSIMPSELWESNFATHDDNLLWPIVDREEALLDEKKRYFDGTRCDAGHCCERYLKNDKCVECCKLVREAKPISSRSHGANSSASPG